MPPNVVQKRWLGYREAIHQASTAREFAPSLTFRKMDPATALCRRPANFPIFFTGKYQIEPLPLHHEAILRRPFQTTSLASALLLHSSGLVAHVASVTIGIANIVLAAGGVGVANIVGVAHGVGVASRLGATSSSLRLETTSTQLRPHSLDSAAAFAFA